MEDAGFDDNFWLIVLNKTECPYTYTGKCTFSGRNCDECTKETCPIRQSPDHATLPERNDGEAVKSFIIDTKKMCQVCKHQDDCCLYAQIAKATHITECRFEPSEPEPSEGKQLRRNES